MSLRDKGQWVDICEFDCYYPAGNSSHPKDGKYGSPYFEYVIMTDYDKPEFETTTQPDITCGSDFEVNRINLLFIFIASFFL